MLYVPKIDMMCSFEWDWRIPIASMKSDLVEKYPVTWAPTLCDADGTRSPSDLPLFSDMTRPSCTCCNIWGQPMELCIPSLFISLLCAHPKVILPFKEEKLDQKSYSKEYLLHVFPGLTNGHKELLCMQRFPSMGFLHVQWQDRCCYGLWSWRSTNNESVLLLLRTEPSWWQGGLKSCQVWIQNEVSGIFLRHTLRSMLQGLSRVHSGVPRLDALWCLLK